MGTAGVAYSRREPERTVLHKIVRQDLETFLAEVRSGDPDGPGLPRHVEQEFRDDLACGLLSAGFTRWRCTKCGKETVLAFSCKSRSSATAIPSPPPRPRRYLRWAKLMRKVWNVEVLDCPCGD